MCSIGLSDDFVKNLLGSKITSGDKVFAFRDCTEAELNDFWTQHGTHYQMCASQKL